jgi:bifunctional DNA-binding transcriptional regulator/antitoxin component of YhaV-PrlF toxin-antitoxin module
MRQPVIVAKNTSKNQITLPKEIVDRFPGVDYFAVRSEDGTIVLEPFVQSRADEVRRKLASIDISEDDIANAVAWARGQ